CQWGIFLRNHDELTLEMVSDEERDYMYTEYAKDPRMKRNIGIGRRLMTLVDNDRSLAELLHGLLFSLPGSPVLYYGDELGMGDYEILQAENPSVLAFIRQFGEETLLCVNNLSRFAQPVELHLSRFAARTPVELVGRVPFPKIGELPYLLTLGGHSFYWFQLVETP